MRLFKIKSFLKTNFIKNIIIVISGTAVAQAITIIVSPILTRFFTPEEFGLLGLFTAVVSILGTISTGRYEMAVMLPKEEKDALNMMILSFFIAIFISISTLFLLPFRYYFADALGAPGLAPYLILVPIFVILIGWEQTLTHWAGRNKQFLLTSKATISASVGSNIWRIGAGVGGLGAGSLIFGNLLYHIINLLLLICNNGKKLLLDIKSSYNPQLIRDLAIKYQNLPKFRAPNDFISSISQNAPALILAFFFSPTQVGFFWLAKRILGIPSQLISQSIRKVYFQKANEIYHTNSSLFKSTLKLTSGLAVIGFVPFFLVIAFGPWIFGMVFGREWELAGEYGRWLSIWLFTMFINVPSVTIIPILHLEKFFITFELISMSSRLLFLLIGALIFQSDLHAIMLYSISAMLTNFFLIFYVAFKAKTRDLS